MLKRFDIGTRKELQSPSNPETQVMFSPASRARECSASPFFVALPKILLFSLAMGTGLAILYTEYHVLGQTRGVPPSFPRAYRTSVARTFFGDAHYLFSGQPGCYGYHDK